MTTLYILNHSMFMQEDSSNSCEHNKNLLVAINKDDDSNYKSVDNITLNLGHMSIEELCNNISTKKLAKFSSVPLPRSQVYQ